PGEGPDLRGPGVRGRRGQAAGRGDPYAGEHRKRHDAAVGDDLASGASRAPTFSEVAEKASRQEEDEQERETRPPQAPADRGPDRDRRGDAAAGEPGHASNRSRRILRFSSGGAPWARQRARR